MAKKRSRDQEAYQATNSSVDKMDLDEGGSDYEVGYHILVFLNTN